MQGIYSRLNIYAIIALFTLCLYPETLIKTKSFTGIFQGFRLDFKYIFVPELLWETASVKNQAQVSFIKETCEQSETL